MKKLPLLLLAVLLAGTFSACSNPTEIIAGGLKVDLTRIERANDGAVRVTWRVSNPNIVPYLLSKTTHKITVNGIGVGTLVDDSHLGLPAQTQLERTAVLIQAGPAAVAVIEQAMVPGSAAYELDTGITLLIVDDKFEKIRLKAAGTVPVVAGK